MARQEDLGGSGSEPWDPAGPELIRSRASTFVVFLLLFLSLAALAYLCAEHRLSELERTLEAPTEIP